MKAFLYSIPLLLFIIIHLPINAQETDFFVDERDNNIYLVVKFNDQWWMGQNLKYNIGDGSGCFDNDETNCMLKGRLYTYAAALKACPEGYRLPSDDDWKAMETFLGMNNNELDLKYNRNSGKLGNLLRTGGGTGFDVEYAGLKSPKGQDSYFDTHAYFWTSTEMNADNAWARVMQDKKESIDRQVIPKDYSLSIRCMKKATGSTE